MARRSANRRKRANPSHQVRIRMYRLGVGDCFLLSFPRSGRPDFQILIDCGVHPSQKGGSNRLRKAVADIRQETGGRLDVLVVTHEHADHISGFRLAKNEFAGFEVGEIWLPWTEDDRDPLARELAGQRRHAVRALANAHARMRLLGLEGADNPLEGLLGFFGGGDGAHSVEAWNNLKALSPTVRYRRPGELPTELEGVDCRAFVLGPPRSKELIGKDAPSTVDSEVYHFGAYGSRLAALEPALGSRGHLPFDSAMSLPIEGTRAIGFFQTHYWSDLCADVRRDAREDLSQDWRRPALDWLDAATSLALKLDEDTNNTSLVLAFELGEAEQDGPVLLFAADAQVGSWLSWQDVVWPYYRGRRITGPDLLRRTRVYKVGHHASHNATLEALGLEMMDALELALISTDDKMAKKVGWGTLPWPPLLTRLEQKTHNRVLRTDRPFDGPVERFGFKQDDLYYEVTLRAST